MTYSLTLIEWLVDCPDHGTHKPTDEKAARYNLGTSCPRGRLLRRERIIVRDQVTEWEEAE